MNNKKSLHFEYLMSLSSRNKISDYMWRIRYDEANDDDAVVLRVVNTLVGCWQRPSSDVPC